MVTAVKTVSVSLELLKLIEQYKISPSECFRVGASIILSEFGEPQFINKLNIGRKIGNMAAIIAEQQKKIEEFENVLEKER